MAEAQAKRQFKLSKFNYVLIIWVIAITPVMVYCNNSYLIFKASSNCVKEITPRKDSSKILVKYSDLNNEISKNYTINILFKSKSIIANYNNLLK